MIYESETHRAASNFFLQLPSVDIPSAKMEGPKVSYKNMDMSLFEEGGNLVVIGPYGLGKMELAEYMIHTAFIKYNMLPLICNSG